MDRRTPPSRESLEELRRTARELIEDARQLQEQAAAAVRACREARERRATEPAIGGDHRG